MGINSPVERYLPHQAASRAGNLERAKLAILRKMKDDLVQPNACVLNAVWMIDEVGRH